MAQLQTFAYLLLASDWSKQIEAEVAGWSYSDAIELFLEREDQASEPEDLWIFDWDRFAARAAPVQLTLGWDPRPSLVYVFREARIQPRFRLGASDEQANILYYDGLPRPEYALPVPGDSGLVLQDELRFRELLTATIGLARRQERGVLFVGGWGWSYHADQFQGDEAVLRRAGMQFFDRHP